MRVNERKRGTKYIKERETEKEDEGKREGGEKRGKNTKEKEERGVKRRRG